MKTTKRILQGIIFTIVSILALMMPQTIWATGGTDGTELQVAKPESLEIQLGTKWSGVEFQLKTDAGMYPGDIVVGEDGVLRLEIGGSESYILTCMHSSVAIPDLEQASATNEVSKNEDSNSDDMQSNENTIAGIPTMHLIMFGGGMLIAVGTLVGLYVVKRRKQSNSQYQDDDDDE